MHQNVGCSFFSEQEERNGAGCRSPPFFLGSKWEDTAKFDGVEGWKLIRNQLVVVSSKIVYNKYPRERGQNSEGSLSKLPEVPHQLLNLLKDRPFGFHKITSEDSLDLVWDTENLKYFSSFKIINPHPIFLSRSGFTVWMLDNHGRMFEWNEMETGMRYMGADLVTGLKNYLFYPDNILDMLLEEDFEYEERLKHDYAKEEKTGKRNKKKKKKSKNRK